MGFFPLVRHQELYPNGCGSGFQLARPSASLRNLFHLADRDTFAAVGVFPTTLDGCRRTIYGPSLVRMVQASIGRVRPWRTFKVNEHLSCSFYSDSRSPPRSDSVIHYNALNIEMALTASSSVSRSEESILCRTKSGAILYSLMRTSDTTER